MPAPRVEVHIDLHLILVRNGQVLLGRRINTAFGAGQYHVPAGYLEPNETVLEGVRREAREEVGIEIPDEALDLVHLMHFRGTSDRISLFFIAHRWTGDIVNREPDKCAGWAWWKLDRLPTDMVPYARRALTDIGPDGVSASLDGTS